MSYDVSLMIDTGNKEGLTCVVDCGNYTSNVGHMYHDALNGGIHNISNVLASKASGLLEIMINNMVASPSRYRGMNPVNGWGDYEGALKFIIDIKSECDNHPLCMVYLSA